MPPLAVPSPRFQRTREDSAAYGATMGTKRWPILLAEVAAVGLIPLERRVHLAALRALGWPRRDVVLLLAGQAGVLGLTGGLLASAAVWRLGVALDASH